MRNYPDDDDDKEYLAKLSCELWMAELLKLNPSYVHWGPHEDYMFVKGDGWSSPLRYETWKDLAITLNDLNEVVNFYFEVGRDSKRCEICGGSGCHPDAQWISESFHRHSSPFLKPSKADVDDMAVMVGFGTRTKDAFDSELQRQVDGLHGRGVFPTEATLSKYQPEFRTFCEEMLRTKGYWGDDIDDLDRAALVKDGRDPNGVNGLGHDAIDRYVMVKARCERYGVPFSCVACDGSGDIYTAPDGHVGLVLWLLHPRKGASRGVEIVCLEKDDLPSIFAFLKKAAERNASRFAEAIAMASS